MTPEERDWSFIGRIFSDGCILQVSQTHTRDALHAMQFNMIEMPLQEKHRLHVPSRNNETAGGNAWRNSREIEQRDTEPAIKTEGWSSQEWMRFIVLRH